jgi:nicotinate-nucleotide pyrophosphorylase (carboxylating)
MLLSTFPSADSLLPLIHLAIAEDLGSPPDDVTSRLMVPEGKEAVATLVQKEVGVCCGLPLVDIICRTYDPALRVEQIPGFHQEILEGRFNEARTMPLLRIRGPMRSLLSAERVVLNFLQRLSGVATATQRFVRRIEGTPAQILDTRKTLPGFRTLDKYAVRAGGGHNHRMGLYDGLLIKDNHLAPLAPGQIAPFLRGVVATARREAPSRLVEVEVDRLDQLAEVLKVDGIDVILLDNMDCPAMEQAVALRAKAAYRPQLEASGGVTLETVRSIAQTGVERISVGAITHSAKALDLGLDLED